MKKEEADLEKAALEFDGFLEDNDRKAMDALRQAEQETKLKLAKAKEIKKLQLALISLRSEISKSEEQLRDSLRCRKLLELLTPRDWLEQHVYQPRRERKAERDRIAAQALAAAAAESSQSTQNALLAGRRMSKVAPNLRNTIKTITNGIRQVRIASISGPSAAAAGDDANGARTAGSGTGGKVPSRRGSLAMHRRSSASMTAGAKGSTDSSLANKKATNESDAAPAQPVNDDPLAEISIDDPDAFDLEAVLAKLQDFEGDVEIPIYFTEPEQLLREFEKLDKENVELERLCKEEEEKVHRLEKDLEAEVIKA